MSSSLNLLERKNVAAGRAASAQASAPAAPASPHTPRRNPSSTYSSPGSGLRPEEEFVVVELTARNVVVGLAGDPWPKCVLGFTREESRRVGDYRRWLPKHSTFPVLQCKVSAWGRDNELWQPKLRDVDLSLVEDKLERAMRDAFTRYLLHDSKAKRLVVILPSLLPHPVLASILTTFFRNFQPPGIVLLPAPTTSVLGAGQRSGLVIDIGWHETVITAVYEFREVKCDRSIRAMRLVTLAMARILNAIASGAAIDLKTLVPEDDIVQYDFEFAEDVTDRFAWCRPISSKGDVEPEEELSELKRRLGKIVLDNDSDIGEHDQDATTAASQVRIPKGSQSEEHMYIPFAALSLPAESTLFGRDVSSRTMDDEERTVHMLTYEVLSALDPDVRSTCMSRIIFTGAGARLPGLKTRVMNELSHLRDTRGWDPVWGSAADKHREKLREIDQNRRSRKANIEREAKKETGPDGDGDEDALPPGSAEPPQDKIYEKIRQAAAKEGIEQARGTLGCIESLGTWQGASMAASLKLKGVVEIDRDAYLQHGLNGAHRDNETHETRSRKSMGATLARQSVADTSAWTLGLWGA